MTELNQLKEMLPFLIPLAIAEFALFGYTLYHILTHKTYKRGNRAVWLVITIVLWIASGIWYLFALWALVAISWGTWVSKYYFDHINYICPECHEVFKPRLKEVFWAYHTPRMRRLTCPRCGRRGLCVEIYADKEKKHND